MQVTGQIVSVQARIDNNTNAQMYWSGHGKTFYTFDMTVQGPNGQVSGEISSTSPNVYPKAAGAQITVEPYEQNGYPKLKAISEQNRQPQQQQAPPQQGGYQQPQQQQPPQQAPQQQDSVQDRIAFAQAYNRANDEYIADKITEEQIKERTKIHYKVLTTRQFPFTMALSGPQEQAPPPQQNPAPAQNFENPPFSPTDDIPF